MVTHSSALAWNIQGQGAWCYHLRGRTESHVTEVTAAATAVPL